MGTVSILPVISSTVEEGIMRWLRAAELTCDRAALLVAQDRDVVISALMKLAGGTPSFANELNIDAFLQQVCAAITFMHKISSRKVICQFPQVFSKFITTPPLKIISSNNHC